MTDRENKQTALLLSARLDPRADTADLRDRLGALERGGFFAAAAAIRKELEKRDA